MDNITICNLKNRKPNQLWQRRVDRTSGSPLGNNFIMNGKSLKERNRVCDEYEEWFYQQLDNVEFMKEIRLLRSILFLHGKLELYCWCYPERCHAETIKSYLEGNEKWID